MSADAEPQVRSSALGMRSADNSGARTREKLGLVGAGGVCFTRDESWKASDEWNFNCGPGALCAVTGLTPSELRPHMLDFESKGYTNPTLMYGVLDALGVTYRQSYRGDVAGPRPSAYPRFGLARIQWEGPWTKPGVPMAARYRKTHWIATRGEVSNREVFDINAITLGGWIPWCRWETELVPWLIRECVPKGNGCFYPTHGIEVLSLGGGGAELAGDGNAETRSRAASHTDGTELPARRGQPPLTGEAHAPSQLAPVTGSETPLKFTTDPRRRIRAVWERAE